MQLQSSLKALLLSALCIYSSYTQAQTIVTIAGNYAAGAGYSGDGGAPLSARFNSPAGIAIARNGDIFIADQGNHVIRRISGETISTFAGTGTPGYSGDGGPATSAKLYYPSTVAVDSLYNVYFTDDQNNVVRKVSADGMISTIAGTGSVGFSGDYGPATSAKLNNPSGIAVDVDGTVYISDAGNNVIRAVDLSDTIFTVAGTGTAGSTNGGGAFGAEFTAPASLTIDIGHGIYISDLGNSQVRKLNRAAGTVSYYAGISGSFGFSGDGGYANAAQLNVPEGLYMTKTGMLYIADYGNHRIRRVTSGGAISTVVGNGTAGYSGDGGNALDAQLFQPFGIALDSYGNMYIADKHNNVIRKVTASTGIDDASNSAAGFTIWPNPASNRCTILPDGKAEHVQVSIYNLLGQLQAVNLNVNNGKIEVDLSNIPSGVYTVVAENNGSSSRQKLVVE